MNKQTKKRRDLFVEDKLFGKEHFGNRLRRWYIACAQSKRYVLESDRKSDSGLGWMRRATYVCSVEGKAWTHQQGGGQKKGSYMRWAGTLFEGGRAGGGHRECALLRVKRGRVGQRAAYGGSFHAKRGRRVSICGRDIKYSVHAASSAQAFLLDGVILDE